MKSSTASILRDPELLAARERHLNRLTRLFAGEPLDHAFVLAGFTGHGRCDPYREPEQWADEALDDLATRARWLGDEKVFRPPTFSLNDIGHYGVHFVDRILGADVFELDGEKNNWQAHTLTSPVGSLPPPDLDHNPTWQLSQRFARAFLASGVTVPFFGVPCLSSALNIGMNLYGQELLVAMMTDPAAAHRDLRIIQDTISHLHRWFIANIPLAQRQMTVTYGRTQPPGYGQLCGCSCQLLSPELYQEFIAPLDDELLSLHPHGGMIHLCGTHTQHIPVWRAMKSLRSIQVNDRAAEDLERYFEGLRDDQMIYVSPCDGMPLDRILKISGGRRVVLAAYLQDPPALPIRART